MGTIDKHLVSDNTKDWKLLKRHTDRLLRLINQILDLTKLESGQFELRPEPGNVTEFLRITSSMFDSVAATRGVRVVTDLPSETLWLHFDRDALEKILFNVISNAVKFTSDNTKVKIVVHYDEGCLGIQVSDQGVGISKAEQHKVFDRYYQAGKKSSEGTGIGLALTKELVDLHNGSVTVASEIGQSTTFTITLPLEKADAPESEETPKTIEENHAYESAAPEVISNTVGQEIVLVVEDNLELSTFIKGELEPSFEVISAYDGEEGAKIAKKRLPDLIISDLMMPRVDGIELCHRLKENELTSHIPIILLTARADLDTKLEGLRTGADDYMIKPFNSDELRTRTRNLIALRKRLQKKYSQLISLGPDNIVITGVDEIFMKKLMTIIENNISDHEFNITDLCREMGTSRMQLHRKLTSLTGLSATAFIRQQRLYFATKLLESREPVSQVAYASGFSSLSYFSTAFKEQFGVSPSEFCVQKA